MGEQEQLQETLTFEQAMEKLERIVAKLESGELPLEQAIGLYQEGTRLSQLCAGKLEQVERKIEMVMETESGLEHQAFNPDEMKGEST
ncbi:exodeoxyribonuclease VII small subunit [Xylanibacillus composti]|nr:exodeoxyribonuclease VII small subunit [Xylanibacillus composti]